MKKYRVEICRIAYGFNKIEVEAEDEQEAIDMALDTAGNYLYTERDAKYEYNDCIEEISK